MTASAQEKGATPALGWPAIAASLYRAYGHSVGHRNSLGLPTARWDDLTQAVQTAWEAAARQADLCLHNSMVALDQEARWAGWTPPQFRDPSHPEKR